MVPLRGSISGRKSIQDARERDILRRIHRLAPEAAFFIFPIEPDVPPGRHQPG